MIAVQNPCSLKITKLILFEFLLQSCSCDVISPSFTYEDGGLHSTSLSTLNANVLRTRSDIQKQSFLFYQILHLRSTCFLVNFPFKSKFIWEEIGKNSKGHDSLFWEKES